MEIEIVKRKLAAALSPKRYLHSVNTMDSAVLLALRYGEDSGKAALAGLLHDCARDLKAGETLELCVVYGISVDDISRMQPELLHGRLGAKLAEEQYGVNDLLVLKAISFHTMGCPGMSLLDRIVFLADYIEPARAFPEAERIRTEAFDDLDKAVLSAVNSTIRYIINKGSLLHPDTVETRNSILKEIKNRGVE